MGDDTRVEVWELIALSDTDRLMVLAWLAAEAPAVMREALTWLDAQTPPQ